MTTNTPRIGPYSRPTVLAKLDGRRREAKLLRLARAELTEHVGGSPNVVQRQIIERAAILRLRLEMLDAQTGPDGTMAERIAREYLCWNNAYARLLAQLGLEATKPPQPTIRDILAQRAAAGR